MRAIGMRISVEDYQEALEGRHKKGADPNQTFLEI